MFSGKYQLRHLTGFLVVMVIIGVLAAAIASPVAADGGGGTPPDPLLPNDSLPISGESYAANPQDVPSESQIIYDLAAFLITAGI